MLDDAPRSRTTTSSPPDGGRHVGPPEQLGPPPGASDRDARLYGAAEAALRANWRQGRRRRDGTPYAFTCPAPPRYRHMWHWDSCFHAVAWRRFDPARARAELRTVLRSGRDDGFLPHTVFWHWPAGWRRAPFYATGSVLGSWFTESINPPLLPFVWELVADASPDHPGFRTEDLAALGTSLDWLAHHRDPDGDGLLTIVAPDESGLDDAPKYDAVYGRMSHDRLGYFWLMERSRRLGWHSHTIIERYDHHVEDVLVNVAYALSLRAQGRMTGDPLWAGRAARTEAALLEKCLDPATGLFFDLHGPDEEPVRVSTWSALAPLALEALPEDVRRRLVEEHLLHPERYLAPYGVPSVAIEEPAFHPGFDRWRTWRGPSWVNTAWMLVPPMRRLGYEAEAARIVEGLAAAADRDGLREYYHPFTGAGLASKNFGWSTLLLDLL